MVSYLTSSLGWPMIDIRGINFDDDEDEDAEEDYKCFGRETIKSQSAALLQLNETQERRQQGK